MVIFPEPLGPLSGERAALRFAAERDIPEVLIAHQDDPQLADRLGLERPPSGAELGRRVEASAAARAAGAELWLTILAAESTAGSAGADECRGQLEVGEVDSDHRRAELKLWVAPQARGRGLGRDALVLAAGLLVGDLGLRRVALLAEPANGALRACARGAGFAEEGVLRGHRLTRRGRVDVCVYSLVRADLAAGG